ncbi:MAG: flagellinolysin, partial [Pseudomonadota bacterium]
MTDTIQTSETYKKLRFKMIELFEGSKQAPYMDDAKRTNADGSVISNPQVTIGVGFNIKGNRKLRDAVYDELDLDAVIDKAWRTELDNIIIDPKYLANDKVNIKNDLDAVMARRNGTIKTFSLTDEQIETIFNVAILDFETILDTWLGGVVIKEEGQRAALVSLAWNAFIHDPIPKKDPQGNPFISIGSPKLNQALKDGNRAEAWYEMRYIDTPAGRHFTEAQVFGLYDNPASVSDAEAKKVVDMFIGHKDAIVATGYEVKATFDIANAYLATNALNIKSAITNQNTADTLGQIFKPIVKYIYTRFTPADIKLLFPATDLNINGDVVLGYETSSALSGDVKSIQPIYVSIYNKNPDGTTALPKGVTGINDFLMALDGKAYTMQGLYGNDVIIGADKDDTLYGGFATEKVNSGNDILMGAGGDDKLYGQDGYDFLYGGVGKDTLDGGADADHLYGGDGTEIDVLNGGDGNDILEGGTGTDKYIFSGNFGRDMIKDTDGKIYFGADEASAIQLAALKQTAQEGIIYRDATNTYQAIKINEGNTTSLIISSIANSNNSITIKNWVDGQLNINLAVADIPVASSVGLIPLIGNGNANYLFAMDAERTTHIKAEGGAGRDLLMGTWDGSDHLSGGNDNDIILGGNLMFNPAIEAIDYLNGNDGEDYIVATGRGSVVHGGNNKDILSGMSNTMLLIPAGGEQYEIAPGVNLTISQQQMWADFSNHMHPQIITTTLANGNSTTTLSGLDSPTTDIWQRFPSIVPGAFYWFIQRPEKLGSDKTIVQMTYASAAPEIKTGANGEWVYEDSLFPRLTYHEIPDTFYGYTPAELATVAAAKGMNLFGDAGDDNIFGSMSSDYLSGGAEKDEIWGRTGDDIIDGGTEVDILRGGAGNDTLIGGAGDDLINGDGENATDTGVRDNDVLYGGDGKDTLWGDYGDDYLDGGANEDTLMGGAGKDYLYGGDDNVKDNLLGEANNDILVVGKLDAADGGAGDDIYIWHTHQVTTTAIPPSATLANANDASSGNTLADNVVLNTPTQQPDSAFIIDGQGNNTLALIGEQNINNIAFEVSDNHIYINTGGNQQIVLQDGVSNTPTQIIAGKSAEQVASSNISFTPIIDDTFLNGTDLLAPLQINTASLMLTKLQQAVNTMASTTNTFLAGGLVNDALTAHIGGTHFIGGRGDDTLNGNIGNDIYLIRAGDGNDIITEKGGINTIKLDAAITAAQLTTPLGVRHVGADLFIQISAEQSITVKNMFDVTTGAVINANSIQSIKFYDNTTWDIAKIKQQILTGTNANDVIGGFEISDIIKGGKGSDQLDGGAGSDVYQYALGDGNDVITDASGFDRIEFTSGVLQSQVMAYRDGFNSLILQLSNGEKITFTNAYDDYGNPTTHSLEAIQFSDGSSWSDTRIQQETFNYAGNIIIGGLGDNVLAGSTGDDIYRYSLGDGNDVITDTAGNDRIEFTAGVTSEQATMRSNGADLILTLTDGGTIIVKDMFVNKSQTAIDPVITSVIHNLQNNWMSQAETLIKNHYGLEGSGDITLKFQHGVASAEAAHVEITTPVGANSSSKLELIINLDDFSSSPNGSGPLYYDRIIAHEMVHAVMARNMNMEMLPGWFTEGAAEFIHGADERVKSDMSIIGNQSNFNLLFKTTVGSPSHNAGYSVSYIAVKLLDSEIRANGGAGIKELFAELKTGKSLSQSLAAISLAHGGMGGLWNNLGSFETHFQAAGFASMNTLLNLTNADTGSIAGSDYGNASLDPYAVISNASTGPSQYFNLVVREGYQNTVGVVNQIESITFTDDVTLGVYNIKEILLTGTPGNDEIYGFDSDDYIRGQAGNDIIYGGAGGDQLFGDEGNNQLNGGAGNDHLWAGNGEDILNGGIGNDWFSTGAGNNTLNDDGGDDFYLYNYGTLSAVINDTAGNNDVLQLSSSLQSGTLVSSDSANNLIIALTNGGNITIKNAFDSSGNITANMIETLKFADGSSWNTAKIKTEALNNRGKVLIGTAADEPLNGYLGNDVYQYALGGGNDVITDTGGIDRIELGVGITQEQLIARRDTTNNLILQLPNSGSIKVTAAFDANGNFTENAIESIVFADNSSWNLARIKVETLRAFDLTINGTNGNDILTGGIGNDTYNGGGGFDYLGESLGGNDTYTFKRGDGINIIQDSRGSNTLSFSAGINPNDVMVYRSEADMYFLLNNGEMVETIGAYKNGLPDPATQMARVTFANGDVWNAQMIEQKIAETAARPNTLIGRSGWDTFAVSASTGNYYINGLGGKNNLFGGLGNDTLVAGSGIEDRFGNPVINDMNGGAGNDTYLIGEAPSRNYIKDFRGDNDRVLFSEGIKPTDVAVRIVHPDNFSHLDNGVLWVNTYPRTSDWQLLLTFGDKAHPTSVAIDSLFNSFVGATIKNPEIVTGTVEFMNGTVWNVNDLIGRALLGSASSDTINGTGNNDQIQGGDGNDIIFGYSGDDTITGGLGNDMLSGGLSNDIYKYALGDGSDTIDKAYGNDRLEFGSGITASSLTFKRNYDSLLVSINGSS